MTHMPLEEILQESKEIALDYSCIEPISFSINSSVLILGQSQDAKDLFTLLSQNNSSIFLKDKNEIHNIKGHFGCYEVLCEDENFIVGQIVSFYEDKELAKLKGCHLASSFSDPQALKEVLNKAYRGGGIY